MKKGICEKCQKDHILVFDRFVKTKWKQGTEATEEQQAKAAKMNYRVSGDTLVLDAYCCRACGYTELYLPEPDPSTIDLKEGKFREIRGSES